MGSIILCHKQKAKHPYEVTRIHKKIYTIEELCYYLTHNIYLIDNTIMNEQFCTWLIEDLGFEKLGYNLKEALLERCGREQFVLAIVSYANIYTQSEINHIKSVLEKLEDQKDIERQKYKGDSLLNNGEVEEAILVYQSILRKEKDETVHEHFYGKVYACLGAAFGRCFLYQEAMEMYDKAFQICNDPMLVKCYLYAAKNTMEEKEYLLFLSKSEVFEELNEILKGEIDKVESNLKIVPSEELFEQWKNRYRKGM